MPHTNPKTASAYLMRPPFSHVQRLLVGELRALLDELEAKLGVVAH